MIQLSAYAQERRTLIVEICAATGQGRHCFHCRKRAPSYLALEIDHLDGKGWVANKVNSWQRLRILRRELAAGARLVGSCGTCNQSTGATRRYKWKVRRRRDRGGFGYSNYAVAYARHLAAMDSIQPDVGEGGAGLDDALVSSDAAVEQNDGTGSQIDRPAAGLLPLRQAPIGVPEEVVGALRP